MSFTLGIDIGTTNAAAVILNTENNTVAASASRPHRAALPGPPLHAEQNPKTIMEAVSALIRSLPAELRTSTEAVGVTGQMHSVMGWNSETIFPLITWQDQRTKEKTQYYSKLAGCRLFDGFGGATLAWLAEQGVLESWNAAAGIGDFAVRNLCGNDRVVTDYTYAAGWGLYDQSSMDWNRGAIHALGIPERLLPTLCPIGAKAGELSEESAEELGLSAGIPVMTAIGDNQASILDCGEEFEKEVFLTIGTGSQLSIVVRDSEIALFTGIPGLEPRPFSAGRSLVVSAPLCGGRAFAWLGETVNSWLSLLGCREIPLPELLDRLDALGTDAVPDGLNICPSFLGERHAPGRSASIHGITLENCSPGGIVAALTEGIVRNLIQPFPPEAFSGRTRVMGSGNGIRRIRSLQKQVERMLHLELRLRSGREEAACGCARLAGNLAVESSCECIKK